MLTRLKNSWPVVFLLLISVAICVANYTPGTFLSGWDTLHPEFNFGLAFERTINGVFRTEQGLGAVAAHSHMADLPRIVILYFAHFILPLNFLRYFYIDLCIIFGTLGMYFFLKKSVLKDNLASFLGSLFYLLNIGTVQTFNVPFEMFTTLFATLPFMFLFATEYLHDRTNRRKHLLFFAVTMLFNAPSAYAATLWYVFFLCFGVYFLILALLNHKNDRKSLLHFLILIAVTLTVNFFWLLPNIYFVLFHAKEVAGANINLLFSDQAFLKNKEFGNLFDILLLKTFYFDWQIYGTTGRFVDLMSPFITHFQNIFVSIIAYFLAGGFVVGTIVYVKKLKVYALPTLTMLLICLFFLFNDNFPVSLVYGFFQNHVPFFKEALRFPDDKILNIYVFLVSLFFGSFALFVIEHLKKFHKHYHFEKLFTLIAAILIIVYSFPSFTGNFINYFMRVKIPNQYFQLFNYLDTQADNLRVANLPIESPWGWAYYNWDPSASSYQGAGFLYFGIKQPLLDRDFDRWSPYNESYYREMSYAIYKQDSSLLSKVLQKYEVGFIFVDKSVIAPGTSSNALYLKQSEKLIEQTGLVKQKQTFGTIDLYKLKNDIKTVDTISTNLDVSPITTTTYEDFAYLKLGNYVSLASSTGFSKIQYPFRDLITNQSKVLPGRISQDSQNLILSTDIQGLTFQTTALIDNLTSIPVKITAKKVSDTLTLTFTPDLPMPNTTSLTKSESETIKLPSVNKNLYFSLNSLANFDLDGLSLNKAASLGNTQLINGTNTIDIFNHQNPIVVSNTKNLISPVFSSCDNSSQLPTAGVLDNGLKLSGKGSICILIPYSFLPKVGAQTSTILTTFQFNFLGAANLLSCLYNTQTSLCLTNQNPVASGNTMKITFPVASSNIQNLSLKIFINPSGNDNNTYILTDLSSSYEKPAVELNLSKNSIAKMFTDTNSISFSKMLIPRNTAEDTIDIGKTTLTNGCNAFYAKKEIVTEDGINIVKYTSALGNFCDHFSYPNLVHNQGYLLVVNSKNESGLPLTLCVSNNSSRRCDIYANLNAFKQFGNDVFLLPPMDDQGIGFDLDFENQAVKGSPAINYLASIRVIPIPYSYLENIKSQNPNTNPFKSGITSFTEYASWLYLVKAPHQPTIITLDQSFEPNFKAYQINCSSGTMCLLKSIFAPFYASQINNHVLVNNWGNGWILDNRTIKQSGNQQVVIVFLPQYLEFLGFLLLLMLLLLVIYRLKLAKHH